MRLLLPQKCGVAMTLLLRQGRRCSAPTWLGVDSCVIFLMEVIGYEVASPAELRDRNDIVVAAGLKMFCPYVGGC